MKSQIMQPAELNETMLKLVELCELLGIHTLAEYLSISKKEV